MKLLRRRAREDRAEDEAATPAARYERVRTASGRTAHLRLPASSPGVLCGGWPGPWVPAEPLLPVCKLCEPPAAKPAGAVAS